MLFIHQQPQKLLCNEEKYVLGWSVPFLPLKLTKEAPNPDVPERCVEKCAAGSTEQLNSYYLEGKKDDFK